MTHQPDSAETVRLAMLRRADELGRLQHRIEVPSGPDELPTSLNTSPATPPTPSRGAPGARRAR